MKAMIIGAGHIGRGFITELLKPGLTIKTKPSAIVTFENGVNPAKLLQLTADDSVLRKVEHYFNLMQKQRSQPKLCEIVRMPIGV